MRNETTIMFLVVMGVHSIEEALSRGMPVTVTLKLTMIYVHSVLSTTYLQSITEHASLAPLKEVFMQ